MDWLFIDDLVAKSGSRAGPDTVAARPHGAVRKQDKRI
jgi:hypothetical protein